MTETPNDARSENEDDDGKHVMKKEEDSPPRDDEDLLLEYDVILCGTGLVQSILASALARVGKSVLHCDAQGHYGELDTVWTLPFLQEKVKSWQKEKLQQQPDQTSETTTATAPSTNDDENTNGSPSNFQLHPQGAIQSLQILSSQTQSISPFKVGVKVITPFGYGTVLEMPISSSSSTSITVSVALNDWILANGKSPTVYFGIPREQMNRIEQYLAETQDILPLRALQAQTILNQKSRSFALDVTPGVVFAWGSAVQGMLMSGVAEYLDFKSIEALLWLDAAGTQRLSRVPCSKGDVFTSQLLQPLDKRRLMKFLQLALDYATAVQVAQEEASLAATATTGADANATHDAESSSGGTVPADATLSVAAIVNESHILSLNERQLKQGRSLARPQNKAVATDELQELQRCIAENMDFEQYLAERQKLSPALRTLIRYALVLESGIGQCTTLEGMTQLCRHMQALGRYGSTAFLFPLYGSGELPQAFCRSAAVHGATYLLRRAPLQVVLSEQQPTVEGVLLGGDKSSDADNPTFFAVGSREDKVVRCRNVIVPQASIQSNVDQTVPNHRMLRRISIFRGKLIASETDEQRHVIIIPPAAVGNEFPVHAVVLDHSVHVVPQVACGCTLLHLSMMIGANSNVDDQVQILAKAIESLLPNREAEQVDEIFHASFTYDLCLPTTRYASVKGLHICQGSRQGLAVDDAFDQAKEIFTSICPQEEFLAMSTEMDKAVKERFPDHGKEDDEEGMVLSSAVSMLATKDSTE